MKFLKIPFARRLKKQQKMPRNKYNKRCARRTLHINL